MSDTLKIRRFDRLSTGTIRAEAQFRLRRELSRTIRPPLTPALRLGLVGTRHTGALALMTPQHEVVHFIYADQETVGVKIPLNKGDSGGCVFLLK